VIASQQGTQFSFSAAVSQAINPAAWTPENLKLAIGGLRQQVEFTAKQTRT
jgi:hypothetical protein